MHMASLDLQASWYIIQILPFHANANTKYVASLISYYSLFYMTVPSGPRLRFEGIRN